MTIELNEKQLQLIQVALEQHSRMLCGQLELSKIPAIQTAMYRMDPKDYEFEKTRDCVINHLSVIKAYVFPELHRNQSYGIGTFPEADLAYEMYKMINLHFDNIRRKEEGENFRENVHSREPIKLTEEPLITIKDERNNSI